MAIFITPRRGDLSLTHPRSSQTPSENQSYTQESSPQPSLAYTQIPSLVLFLYLFLFHIHTHTPIIRLSNDKRRRRNPKWVTFDPREEAQSYMERVGTVRRGAEVGEERLREAARRTEVPRAGNTGWVKPLEWSLHQSGRHNLRPMYRIPKKDPMLMT